MRVKSLDIPERIISYIKKVYLSTKGRLFTGISEHPLLYAVISIVIVTIIYATLKNVVDATDSLFDGLYGGLVSSIFTSALLQGFNIHSKTTSFKNWLKLGPRDVYTVVAYIEKCELAKEWGCDLTVCGETGDPSKQTQSNYYLSPPSDGNANSIVTHLLRQMGYHYPQRKTVGSYYPLGKIFQDNLIIVCMPHRNQISRVFLGLAYEIYVGNYEPNRIRELKDGNKYLTDDNGHENYLGVHKNATTNKWEIKDFNGTWMQSPCDPDNPEFRNGDYGMILKMPNPFNPNSQVLLVAGLRGIGTHGSALYLYDNAKSMSNKRTTLTKEKVFSRPQAHIIDVRYDDINGDGNILDSEIRIKEIRTTVLLEELKNGDY